MTTKGRVITRPFSRFIGTHVPQTRKDRHMRNPNALYNIPPPPEPPKFEILQTDADVESRYRREALEHHARHVHLMATDPAYAASMATLAALLGAGDRT